MLLGQSRRLRELSLALVIGGGAALLSLGYRPRAASGLGLQKGALDELERVSRAESLVRAEDTALLLRLLAQRPAPGAESQ
jgi:hypothetical protein